MGLSGIRRTRRFALTVSLAVLGVLALAIPAGASAARILYASGHNLDPARLATFGGHTLVDPGNGQLPEDGFDGCSDSEWASALARTDFDVLMVGEDAPDCTLSSDTLTAIKNFVSSGHQYIQTGAHDSENDFMNAVFGFSTTNVTNDSGESLTGTLQPSAAGTPFAGGPATLTSPSETNILGSTPGTTIYAGDSPPGTWVFTVPVGSGVVSYLAWDFCCGSDPVEDDWYRVLDRAIQVKPTPPAQPPPFAEANTCQGQRVTIIGTDGNDTLTGTDGADLLKGGAGDDKLQGNKSADRLIGNGGKDRCRGGKGKDTASSCESVGGL